MAMAAGLERNVCLKRADVRGRLARPIAERRALERQSTASSHLPLLFSQHRPLGFFLFRPACFITVQEALLRAGGENTWLCNVI